LVCDSSSTRTFSRSPKTYSGGREDERIVKGEEKEEQQQQQQQNAKFILEHATNAMGGSRCSSTLSLTSALKWGGWSTPRPGRFIPGKDPVPIVQKSGWSQGPVWKGAENLTPTGFRFPYRPACNESLYRLSYPGPLPPPPTTTTTTTTTTTKRRSYKASLLIAGS